MYVIFLDLHFSKNKDREKEELTSRRIEAKFTVCDPVFEGGCIGGKRSPRSLTGARHAISILDLAVLTFQHRPLAAIIGRITDLDNAILYYSEVSFSLGNGRITRFQTEHLFHAFSYRCVSLSPFYLFIFFISPNRASNRGNRCLLACLLASYSRHGFVDRVTYKMVPYVILEYHVQSCFITNAVVEYLQNL